MSAVFYAPSAYEAFVFALTALSAIKDSKILSGASSAPFLVMLYRGLYFSPPFGKLAQADLLDGVVFFIVMVVIRIWNVWIVRPAAYDLFTP